MAWRDSRRSRRRLLLFSGSIVLGIAALAAIGSLGSNLRDAIEEQTKTLLGADLVLTSQAPFSSEQEEFFRGLGSEQAREIAFSTMIYFVRTEGTRLVQVHVLAGDFPFYGRLETDPTKAAETFRKPGGGALAEASLLRQFDARAGDQVRLGELTTTIAGQLDKTPGETFALSSIAPRVYLAMAELPRTGLLREGSLARYRVYFKFSPSVDVARLVERVKPQLEKFRLRHETVAERKRELGRAMENLYHFLNLAGFISLLLGAVGIASAIHVHIKQKLGTVAVLRCLGCETGQTFAIYLAQGIALGLVGATLGAALGVAIQSALPLVLADFIPFALTLHVAWLAVGRAIAVGFVICLLFALLPLLTVRQVSPLAALRISVEPPSSRRDPWRWLLCGCLGIGIVAFAWMQSRNWRMGLGFAGGLAVVFGILAATSQGLLWLTRKVARAGLSFSLRQGIANLHRPNNRTLLLLLSLGLGTFLMISLYLVQAMLLGQLASSGAEQKPNAILFDIQPAQRDGVLALVKSLSLPVLDETPIITMRLTSIKGRPVETLLSDPRKRPRGWALRREYRSTYSDHLRDGEKLVAGKWHARADAEAKEAPISLEQDIAKDLGVGLGDELVFDVQGVPVSTRVASLREVEWRRIQPNFFVVFPLGILESAPAMHVVVTHVASSDESARLQRAVVKGFPNVSMVDLALVLQAVDSILKKISFVIRFMAMFTLATGLLVLVTALLTGRYQRIQESVLLRTLGASRGQVLRILMIEYLALGLLAALTGIVLGTLAAGLLAKSVFHAPFTPEWMPLLIALALVPGLTLAAGLLMSRGVLNQPPLAILRAEI